MIKYTVVLAISFVLAIIIIPFNIKIFKKLNYKQYIREEGPSSHIKKSGTPTMGGIGIIFSIITTISIFTEFGYNYLFFLISLLGFGAIGFIDDYIKVNLKRNLGFKAYQKILGQLIFSIIVLGFYIKTNPDYSEIILPFFNTIIDIGWLIIPLSILAIIALTNSVNLTDGLDGLASSVTILVSLTLAIIIYRNTYNFNYNTGVYTVAIAGSLLGFLYYNKYPAKIFMGDVGSLALGGALSYIFLVNKLILFIPVIGIIYFIESLSVIIQVSVYKSKKRRVFLMSPIHHHFEEMGWKENKIIGLFVVITLVVNIITLLTM